MTLPLRCVANISKTHCNNFHKASVMKCVDDEIIPSKTLIQSIFVGADRAEFHWTLAACSLECGFDGTASSAALSK